MCVVYLYVIRDVGVRDLSDTRNRVVMAIRVDRVDQFW